MKSGSLPKNYPDSPEAWEKLIAEAPGEDRQPTAEEEAATRDGFVSFSREEFLSKRAQCRTRGANRAPLKERVTIRLSADVVNAFKASGKGWQTRLDRALKQYLEEHPVEGLQSAYL